MANLFRTLGLGRIFYLLYHRPIEWFDSQCAAGGPFEKRRTLRGQREMEVAANDLPPLLPSMGTPLELHLLTGRRFWYQTAFALWTLGRHSARPIAPVIYDDGTLEPAQQAILTRLFPLGRVVAQHESIAKLDALLPRDQFPFLRERWTNYPNLRKLIDPHLGSTGWKLVIDSDLLIFRCPELLVTWLDQPTHPLHAVDCETSYGYSRPLINELAGTPVAERVNVGLCGLCSETLDWRKLEFWCQTLISRERTNYYLEQALVAMLLAGRECVITPVADYVTLPVEPEASACRAVMHHYVASSKRWYFQHNWRQAVPFFAQGN